MHVEVGSSRELDSAPLPVVYVVCLDPARASRVVDWCAHLDPRPGLVAVIRDPEAREPILEAGFDDAVLDSVSMRELVARIKAVRRRLGWRRDKLLRFAGFALDPNERTLWAGDAQCQLTETETAFMRVLIEARGRMLTYPIVVRRVWQDSIARDAREAGRQVHTLLKRLRAKLPRPEAIESVRNIGVRLVER